LAVAAGEARPEAVVVVVVAAADGGGEP
jgi:hypothetical protein